MIWERTGRCWRMRWRAWEWMDTICILDGRLCAVWMHLILMCIWRSMSMVMRKATVMKMVTVMRMVTAMKMVTAMRKATGHEEGHGHEHEHGHEDEHSHPHPHVHRNLHDIYHIIDRLDSNERVKEMARTMFRIVAEAESKAHGLPVEQVHFHEVGAIDSIVDIISAAVCIDNLGVEDVVVSALSEGHGHVHCQHGVLPVPVPATANIASSYGLKLHFTDNDGEMVTPTGAAIAAALRTKDRLPSSCRLLKVGMGAGNKVFKQANVLRAMLLETSQEEDRTMWVLETNLDDCTGEMLGLAMEMLLDAGATDVWYTPIHMKKNRPAYMLSVLCRESSIEAMEEIILTQTTTIGIRRYPTERTILERSEIQVETSYGPADVKVCAYKGRTFFIRNMKASGGFAGNRVWIFRPHIIKHV